MIIRSRMELWLFSIYVTYPNFNLAIVKCKFGIIQFRLMWKYMKLFYSKKFGFNLVFTEAVYLLHI